MKRDGRTLDHGTLETIRKMAVERVREGERPSDVIASYGFHRCTIYGRLKTARGRSKGAQGAGGAAGDRLPAHPERSAGTPGVSLGQRQEPDAVRFRFWSVDTTARARPGRATVRCPPEPGLDRCVAGASGSDPAETVAACLPTRSRSDYALAARNVPGDCAQGQAGQGRDHLLGRIRIPCRFGSRQDLGRQGAMRRGCRSPDSARASAPPRRSVPRAPSGSPRIRAH